MISPVFTVAICTRNRAASLERTLQRLTEIPQPPPSTWDMVVVDNGSIDHTQVALDKFSNRLPLRTFVESQAGLSVARNRAIRESGGSWIVWTDDDVIVGDQWLTTYHDALTASSPPDIAGGPILPRCETEPDAYAAEVIRQFPQVFSLLDLGDSRGPFPPGRVPFGANMVIRRELLGAEGFDPAFGLGGATPILGEDIVLLERLVEKGASTLWLPEASVEHMLPGDRLTRAFVRKWAFMGGRTSIRQSVPSGQLGSGLRIKLWHFARALSTLGREGWRTHERMADRVRRDFEVDFARGTVSELLHLS